MKLYGKKLIMDGDIFYQDSKYITIYNVEEDRKYGVVYNGKEYDVKVDNEKLIFELPSINTSNTISLRIYNNNMKYLESTNMLNITPITRGIIDEDKVKGLHDEIKKYESEINLSIHQLGEKIKELETSKQGDIEGSVETMRNDFEGEVSKIIDLINNLDFYNRDYIDNLPFLKSEDLNELEMKWENISKDVSVFMQDMDSSDISREIDKIKEVIEFLKGELVKIKQDFNTINISIVGFNNFIDKYKKDYKILEKQYNDVYTSYIELQSKKIPLKSEEDIEPFVFVDSSNGTFKRYSYNSQKRPFGVTDDSGNIIYNGFAKVKYANEVHVGDFVYGNKSGIAEDYNSGFVVLNVDSEDICTIFIS